MPHSTHLTYSTFSIVALAHPPTPAKVSPGRTQLYPQGDKAGIDALEKELLAQNAEHKDWTCWR